MREPQNIADLLELRPDFMGLIFWPKSSRCVPFNAQEYVKQKFDNVTKVGVFVNEGFDAVLRYAKEFNLGAIQLHGDESPDFCARIPKEYKVLKAFGIAGSADLDKLAPYADCVDFFLFDYKTKGYGGSGQKFDWSILNDARIQKPFLLSGGLGPDDAATVKSLNISNMIGIDLNSKFEDAPAQKNIGKLRTFLAEVRE